MVGRKLGRATGPRTALRKTLIKQLFTYERIQTTRAKAEAIRSQAEGLITLAKRGIAAGDSSAVHARRLAAARMGDAETVKKLFDDIAPRYENRAGGYTRMVKLGPRLGDAAEIVLLELVEG
ncbi:MAG: 50S ribosomal protein L17 [Anaerolineales bacterium]|nr:50S ribosomal protein L17 [Anaerolineales bacterium]